MEHKSLDMRDAIFGQAYTLAKSDQNVIFLVGDMGAYVLTKFREELPNQFYNVGIAEQNMINMAAGLALSQKTVFVYSIAPFITLRCLEQIKSTVAAMNLHVIIIGGGAGFCYGNDGPTHHSVDDIAVMKAIGNVIIFNPCDEISAKKSVEYAYKAKSPVYIRMDKGSYPDIYESEEQFQVGMKRTQPSQKIMLVSSGTISHLAVEICTRNKGVGHIDICRLDTIDENLLKHLIGEADYIFTLEESIALGGIGERIRIIYQNAKEKVKIKNFFIEREKMSCMYGDREFLLQECKMNLDQMENELKEILM